MRGGVSYVTMMVLNPIIILFYQNCSVIPSQQAQAKATPAVTQRAPAAADNPAPPTHAGIHAANDATCNHSEGTCPTTHTE